MRIGVPKEVYAGEQRVALTPETAVFIQKLGHELTIESGAGDAANYSDQQYVDAGVAISTDVRVLWRDSDVVLKVRAPQDHPTYGNEVELLSSGTVLISFLWPAQNPALLDKLAAQGVTAVAVDSVPRISRAQKLDALSSMANIAGYRAVVEAASHFGRFFTGQITAAGKVPPAKVLVIGAGVAGLAAIGAARGMGAIVRAFDTRPEVKEQVESMGADFLELEFDEDASGEGGYAKVMSKEFIEAEMALFAEQAKEVDIIITTALIPGKPAPELIKPEMIESMRPGSVLVDLAAEQGGNCKLTRANEVIEHHGVTLIGYTDLPSRMAAQSSQLYGTNLRHLLTDLTPEKDGILNVNMDDEVIRGATVVNGGQITWPPPAPKLSAAPQSAAKSVAAPVADPELSTASKLKGSIIAAVVAVAAVFAVGAVAPPAFMSHFTVFALACFVGYQVIWNVTPSLHTPLMSVTNAISGIIVVGALLQISSSSGLVVVLAAIGVLVATINIAGGFLVTQRMLKMFRK